jgi:hypothetical protein
MARNKSRVLQWLLFILLIIGANCSPSIADPSFVPTAEYLLQNPLSRPEFVSRIDPEPTQALSNPQRICVLIYQGALWRPGDDADSLQTHIVNNTVFRINNQVMRPEEISTTGMFPRGRDGQITEDFGSNLQFCYATMLDKGVYTASIETYSLAVERHDYSWAITVE